MTEKIVGIEYKDMPVEEKLSRCEEYLSFCTNELKKSKEENFHLINRIKFYQSKLEVLIMSSLEE